MLSSALVATLLSLEIVTFVSGEDPEPPSPSASENHPPPPQFPHSPSSYLTSTVEMINVVFDDKMFIIDKIRNVLVFRIAPLINRMIHHPL